jgi:uncharacterized tellurite resistance protein B-like protein
MIKKLADKISRVFAATDTTEPDEDSRARAIHTATAVLMTEVARADFDYDESEFSLLLDLITNHFQISPDEAAELANEAVEAAEDHVSLHKFTQLLNKNLSEREKEHIVSLLWQVAYADARLDKHEDSLVLKISDLLYVSRGRVMRLKHDANPHSSDD